MNKNIWRYIFGKNGNKGKYLYSWKTGFKNPIFTPSFFRWNSWRDNLKEIWNDSILAYWHRYMGCKYFKTCEIHSSFFDLGEGDEPHMVCSKCNRHGSSDDGLVIPKEAKEEFCKNNPGIPKGILEMDYQTNPFVSNEIVPRMSYGALNSNQMLRANYLDTENKHYFAKRNAFEMPRLYDKPVTEIEFGEYTVADGSVRVSKLDSEMVKRIQEDWVKQYQERMHDQYLQTFGAKASKQSDRESGVHVSRVKNQYDLANFLLHSDPLIAKDLNIINDAIHRIQNIPQLKVKSIHLCEDLMRHFREQLGTNEMMYFAGYPVSPQFPMEGYVLLQVEVAIEGAKGISFLVPEILYSYYSIRFPSVDVADSKTDVRDYGDLENGAYDANDSVWGDASR